MEAKEILSKSVAETENFAVEFLQSIDPNPKQATIVCLYGDLGSGKTTFVKKAAEALGVGEIVTSPTFVILKRYETKHQSFDNLFHIDAYRLEEGGELLALGFEEMINNPKNIVFIEWPKFVADVLPTNRHNMSFTFIDETTRKIESN